MLLPCCHSRLERERRVLESAEQAFEEAPLLEGLWTHVVVHHRQGGKRAEGQIQVPEAGEHILEDVAQQQAAAQAAPHRRQPAGQLRTAWPPATAARRGKSI